MECSVSWRVQATWGQIVVMKYDDTLCENAEMIFLDSGMKLLKDFTTVLCIDGDVRIF
jgi:hypothetical protein